MRHARTANAPPANHRDICTLDAVLPFACSFGICSSVDQVGAHTTCRIPKKAPFPTRYMDGYILAIAYLGIHGAPCALHIWVFATVSGLSRRTADICWGLTMRTRWDSGIQGVHLMYGWPKNMSTYLTRLAARLHLWASCSRSYWASSQLCSACQHNATKRQLQPLWCFPDKSTKCRPRETRGCQPHFDAGNIFAAFSVIHTAVNGNLAAIGLLIPGPSKIRRPVNRPHRCYKLETNTSTDGVCKAVVDGTASITGRDWYSCV